MGKTFVALALGSSSERAIVVAPAVLREMWSRAAESAQRSIEFVSTESLSRGGVSDKPGPDESGDGLLIVDEAHHFRNPSTKRYDALARIAFKRRVLLLTATPIHNKRRELSAILSLFLGSHSDALSASELARLVVRREKNLSRSYGLPEIESPRFREIDHDDDIPRMLLDLPPPLPPRDAGDGGVLLQHSLIRQWASSDAALQRALLRRLHRATALTAALESGTYPSTSELSAWAAGEDCVQLAFAEIVAPRSALADDLISTVRSHADRVAALLQTMKSLPTHDIARAAVIRAIRRDHAGIRIVAFSQYADTVDALFKHLAPDGRVAALTGRGARVSGGRISRIDAIERFTPEASKSRKPSAAEEVTLLITTDLLSEGVNLQDAAVVVHLDLPWTPARMEQRLGRVARMGSRHERVFSYVIRPPASAEALIRLERVLRDKMTESGIVVDSFQSLTGFSVDRSETETNSPRTAEAINAVLQSWVSCSFTPCSRLQFPSRLSRSATPSPSLPFSATLSAEINGFLALCSIGARHLLVAGDENGLSLDPSRILRLMHMCESLESANEIARVESAVDLIARHFRGLEATGAASRAESTTSPSRRSALHRIGAITSRSRPHERARIASLAARARASLLSRMGVHAERQLETLAAESIDDEQWMRCVAELGHSQAMYVETVDVKAILILRSDTKL